MGIFHDISEVKKSQEALEYQANHDALTGLPNRQLFKDRLGMSIARAKRNDGNLAVLYLDLDNFKHINDSMGHKTGDLLLQGVAERLRATCREEDTVARLGGDEFVVLMPDVRHPARGSVHLAQRIIKALKEPFYLADREVVTQTSVGICLFPDDTTSMDELMKYADMAMYKAKKEGKGRHALFTDEMSQAIMQRIAMSELVPPDEFIPLAEDTGEIIEIGAWVLLTACEQGCLWRQMGCDNLSVSVNLSPKQFTDPHFAATVEKILNETCLPPDLLTLEITENVMVLDVDATVATMRRMADRGVQWSMDDFGTGYSSLKYLQRLPLNEMKIDKSFMAGIPKDAANSKIVTSAVSLARSIGLKVVAEGVETDEQLRFLSACDCNEAQGYFFSKPVEPDAFMEFYNRTHGNGMKR